jgi:hypothetical protein
MNNPDNRNLILLAFSAVFGFVILIFILLGIDPSTMFRILGL